VEPERFVVGDRVLSCRDWGLLELDILEEDALEAFILVTWVIVELDSSIKVD
jgi:hypothetical protein